MNNQLAKTFSPINDQGRLDTRFDQDMIFIYQSIGSGVEEGLLSFNHKTSELEKSYGGYALNLCEAFIKRIQYLDEYERDGSNQYRWKSKMLEDRLREGLHEIGFKPSKVSKLIGAAEFKVSLPSKYRELDWINSLPVSSLYILSTMSHNGLEQAIAASQTREWNKKTDTFDLVPVTKKDLEEIQVWNPKNPNETRGRGSKNKFEDSIVIEEMVEPSQHDLAKELVAIASLIQTKDGWKDPELIEILNQEADKLMSIAHIATLPVTKTITV